MVSLKIDIPPELDPKHVDAISEHVGRLEAASVRADLSDIVGCAKELAESIARVVLGVRGRTPSDKAALRVSGRSEGVEEGPVGFAGVEQGPDPVVGEVGEPESDAFDPLDQTRVGSHSTGILQSFGCLLSADSEGSLAFSCGSSPP